MLSALFHTPWSLLFLQSHPTPQAPPTPQTSDPTRTYWSGLYFLSHTYLSSKSAKPQNNCVVPNLLGQAVSVSVSENREASRMVNCFIAAINRMEPATNKTKEASVSYSSAPPTIRRKHRSARPVSWRHV